MLATHEFGEFVVHNLHHQLARRHRRQNLLTDGLFFDVVGDIFGYLITDIGVKQGLADLLNCLSHIDFGDISLSLQYLERTFQLLG